MALAFRAMSSAWSASRPLNTPLLTAQKTQSASAKMISGRERPECLPKLTVDHRIEITSLKISCQTTKGETREPQRWSHFLRQAAKVDSPMRRTIHHEDAETVFG